MTPYNICFWIWLIAGTSTIFILYTQHTASYLKKLQWMTYNQLIKHNRSVGMLLGFLSASALYAFIGLFVFEPEPIITYIQSVQP